MGDFNGSSEPEQYPPFVIFVALFPFLARLFFSEGLFMLCIADSVLGA